MFRKIDVTKFFNVLQNYYIEWLTDIISFHTIQTVFKSITLLVLDYWFVGLGGTREIK